jgi:hypothetical protein
MDKKTKLLLGVGVVGVGAYLLFKSKKTTPALSAAPAPAKFVGADSFASVGPNQKFNADGKFASVGARQVAADGKFASVGARQVAADGGFASVGQNLRPLSGGMINSTDVVGARAGSQNSGIFANQPFTGDVANMVGANGEPVFANLFGSRRRKRERAGKVGSVEIGPLEGSFERADGAGSFFDPRTARYGQNQGVFAPKKAPMPKRTLPVEPNRPMPVTQAAPLNNLVGADGGFFAVHDGFGK